MKRKFFTIEERKKIEEKLKKKSSFLEISLDLKRSISGVRREIRINGGIEVYNAEMAQERALHVKKLHYEKSSIKLKKYFEKNPKVNLHEKISRLEWQIEILTDAIKDLKRFYDSKN